MTEEEKKNIGYAMSFLELLLDEMEDDWDETEPLREPDYIKWREMIIKADDILLELREG